MAEIVKSIGPGRDYASLADFAAAVPSDLTAVDESWTAELAADQTDPGGAVFTSICDASRRIRLRAAPGHGLSDRYDPAAAPLRLDLAYGAWIAASAGDAVAVAGAQTLVEIENIQISSAAGAAIARSSGAVMCRRSVLQGVDAAPIANIGGGGGGIEAAVVIQLGHGPALGLADAAAATSCALVRPNAVPGAAAAAVSHDGSGAALVNSAVIGFIAVDPVGGLTQAANHHDYAPSLNQLEALGEDPHGANAGSFSWSKTKLDRATTPSFPGPDGATPTALFSKAANDVGKLEIFVDDVPEGAYTLRWWTQSETLNAASFAYAILDRDTSVWLAYRLPYAPGDGVWRELRVDYDAPAGDHRFRFQFYITDEKSHAGDFRIDLARMEFRADLAAFVESTDGAALDLRPVATAADAGAPLSGGDPGQIGALDLLGRPRAQTIIGPLALLVASGPSAAVAEIDHFHALSAPNLASAPPATLDPLRGSAAHGLDAPAAQAAASVPPTGIASHHKLAAPNAAAQASATPTNLVAAHRLTAALARPPNHLAPDDGQATHVLLTPQAVAHAEAAAQGLSHAQVAAGPAADVSTPAAPSPLAAVQTLAALHATSKAPPLQTLTSQLRQTLDAPNATTPPGPPSLRAPSRRTLRPGRFSRRK